MGELLQRRYRRLLTVLPKAYRAERGEELLAVLMDKSGPRQKWPTVGEVFSLAGLGIRARLGTDSEQAAITGRAEAIRNIALLSVLLMAMNGTVEAVQVARFSVHFGGLGWRRVLGAYAGIGWLFAYVALVVGMRRTGRALCVALFATAVVGTSPSFYGLLPYATFYDLVPYALPAGAVVLSFRRGAAPVRHRRRWLAALALAAAFGLSEISRGLPAIFHVIAPVSGVDVMYAILLAAAMAVCVQAWTSPVWPVAAGVASLGSIGPLLVETMTNPYVSLDPLGVAMAALSVGSLVLAVLSAGKQRLVRRDLPSRAG